MPDYRSKPRWMWLLSSIGLYTVTVHILQFVADLGKRLRPPVANAFPVVGSPAFLKALAIALDTPIRRGGTVEILNNGDEFFPALLKAIHGARHHIHLMTYIWRKSTISDQILDVLCEKARSGVEVRILIDGIGSLFAPRKQFERLRTAGGEVEVFGSLVSSSIVHVNRRNHRRAMVIDGRLGFTGGMSISKDWKGDAEDPTHWRDTMIRVTGPLAHAVQSTFLQLWVSVRTEQLVGEAYFPECEEGSEQGPVHLAVAHVPSVQIQPLLHFYWFSIKCARERIYLASAYFAPNRHMRQALIWANVCARHSKMTSRGHMKIKLKVWKARPWYYHLRERTSATLRAQY